MSKGKITENLGYGKYRVKLFVDIEAIKERIKALDEQIAQSNELISGKLQTDIDTAKAELDAIDTSNADSDTVRKLMEARNKYDTAVSRLTREKVERQGALDEKGKLNNVDEETEKELWCADYNTELEVGLTVGIVDLYQYRRGSTSNRPLLVPAYINTVPENRYNPVRDGRLVPAFSLSPNSWWYAWAVCAGLERYNPRYRKGRITDIDDKGLCDVTVDSNYTQVIPHKAKALTAKEVLLKKVPVRYLTCDALAFAVGDRVLLEYPRKNIHKQLINIFAAKRSDLAKLKTKAQASLTELETQISDKQAEIDALQETANTLTDTIKTDADASGITALQAEIDAIDAQLVILKEAIETANDDRNAAEVDVNSISGQLADKQEQLTTLQQELTDLIANGAPPEDIAAKEAEINACEIAINNLLDDLQVANQEFSDANALFDLKTAEKLAKQAERASKQEQVFPLLSIDTEAKQTLKITLNEIVYQGNLLRKIEDKKLAIDTRIADIDLQILKLQNVESIEQGRDAKLKAFTDTRPKEITIVGFESNPKPCGVSLTFMKSRINTPPLTNDPPGIYPNAASLPFQINDYRLLYQNSRRSFTTHKIYAGGHNRRVGEYGVDEGDLGLPLASYPHSEGGSWRGKLKSGDRQQVAVSWAYYDESNWLNTDNATKRANGLTMATNNVKAYYGVYIGGRWGLLDKFSPNADGHNMPIAGMCLFDPKKIGETGKYALAVLYRTDREFNTLPYIVTYTVAKSGVDRLSFTLVNQQPLATLWSNDYNTLIDEDHPTDPYYSDLLYIRQLTGFTADGLHVCVSSIEPQSLPYINRLTPRHNVVELIRFDETYTSYEVSTVYDEPVQPQSNILEEVQYADSANVDYFGVFADDNGFSAYRYYIAGDGLSINAINMIDIPLDGFWHTAVNQLGGLIIDTGFDSRYREMVFCSTNLGIYAYYENSTDADSFNRNWLVVFIDEQEYRYDLTISQAGLNVTNTAAFGSGFLPKAYRQRWMNAPYTDSLLILGTFDPYAPMSPLAIDLQTKEITTLSVLDAEVQALGNGIVAPLALTHLPY